MISDLEIKADDFTLSDYFDLTKEPDRQLFPTVETESVKLEGHNGEKFSSATFGQREINLEIYLYNKDVRSLKDKLAEVLMLKEFRLWFSDEPDRYFIARLDGESTIERAEDHSSIYTGELKFIVLDGVAHATEVKTFEISKDEDGEPLASVINKGTTPVPLDIHTTFLTDANSIGFVNDDTTVQFGTTFTEDESDFVASERIIRDGMGPAQKGEWKVNIGRPRFKYGDEDTSSKVRGGVRWEDSVVRISDYGTIKDDDPGYWHGPTLTRNLSASLDNFTAYFRFKMKPGGKRKNRPKSQGLLEINLMDADNNFVMGFGLKDNDPNKAKIMYDFFVGDYRVFRGNLPKKVLNYTTGIFGYVELSKVGNQFTFRLCHLKEGFKENWSVKKSYHNDSVAMLSFKTINFYGAQWKRVRDMITEWTSTTITKVNTEDDTLIPLTFNEGDELFVEGNSNRVFVNGIRSDDYRVIGSSQLLMAPVGQSEYDIITDGKIDGYVELEERYL